MEDGRTIVSIGTGDTRHARSLPARRALSRRLNSDRPECGQRGQPEPIGKQPSTTGCTLEHQNAALSAHFKGHFVVGARISNWSVHYLQLSAHLNSGLKTIHSSSKLCGKSTWECRSTVGVNSKESPAE